jgi:hypothetical protein
VVIPLDSKTTLRLRAGREMVGLGTERLVGTRYGPNVPLAFDGGRAIVHRGGLTLNTFYLRPVEPGTGTFDDHTSQAKALWGAYATQMIGPAGVDLYWLGYRNDLARFQNASGREIRHTLGLRLFGKAPPAPPPRSTGTWRPCCRAAISPTRSSTPGRSAARPG